MSKLNAVARLDLCVSCLPHEKHVETERGCTSRFVRVTGGTESPCEDAQGQDDGDAGPGNVLAQELACALGVTYETDNATSGALCHKRS